MGFKTKFDASFISLSDNIRLDAPLIYEWRKRIFVINAGFISDGASIPKLLWPLLGHPFDWRWRRESVLHDFFYRTQPQGVRRKDADKIFRKEIRARGLSWIRSWSMYAGLRAGGWVTWRKHKNNQGV